MKCIDCSREVELWHTYCPHCQNQIQPRSYSTIAESSDSTVTRKRQGALRKTLQFVVLAITLIVLASIIRFTPPKANPSQLPDNNLSPAPITAEVAIEVAPTPQLTPSVPVEVAPLNVKDFAKQVEPPLALAPKAVKSAAADSTPVVTTPDEATVKKLATPLPSSALPVIPNNTAAVESAAEAEAAQGLEVEASAVILHPNTGLVTIKSYVPARVYIDGVYSGVTPRSVKLLAGTHVISLMADGYHEYVRQVKVNGQQQLGILAGMSKKNEDQR